MIDTDYIIEKKLERDIFTNNVEYFITTLTDRFEYANVLWANALEKRFGKKFKPIFIQNCKQNGYFKKDNYIIMNKTLAEETGTQNGTNFVCLEDYEDLNTELSESKTVKLIIKKLIRKQKRLFFLDFTSSFLNLKDKRVVVLGPKSKMAFLADSKIWQIKLFKKLNLPMNNVRIYDKISQISENENYPFYVSAAYTSGGYESGPIKNKRDMDKFVGKLRKVNLSNQFLVGRLIRDMTSSPNVNAIVYDKNKTEIICITDQILRGNVYLGNIYPSAASPKAKGEIIKATKTVGNYLSAHGFRGLFGLDFIIDSKDKIYTVDLNPRRQGGYLCNILMSKKLDIVDLELKIVLKEKLPRFSYEDFQCDFAWAHSKVKPHGHKPIILKEFNEGKSEDPFDSIGSSFRCVFYPKGSVVIAGNCGYVIQSSKTRKEVEKVINEKTVDTLLECFGEHQ